VAGTCECGNEPSGSIKCWEFLDYCKPVGFSRRTLLRVVTSTAVEGMSTVLSVYVSL
jgi:hypothetical protein